MSMPPPWTPPPAPQLYPVNESDGYRLKTPIFLLSVFVAILRQYFGTPQRISLESSSYLWDQDQGKSNLWISEEHSFDRKTVGKRPAILLGLEQQSYGSHVIGDYLGNEVPSSTRYLFNMVQVPIRFRCISENMLSSMELATEVRYFIGSFREQLEKTFCISKLRPQSTSKTQMIEEYKEYWVTDLVCTLDYQESWGVTIEKLRVKSVFTELKISDEVKNILPQQTIQ